MKKSLITIQQQQFNTQQLHQLQALVIKLYAEYISDERLVVIFCEIPSGQAYTNYATSRSSIVSAECIEEFPQEKRVAFLKTLSAEWVKITGQTPHELMLSLVETPLFKQIISSNQRRLSMSGRIKFIGHILSNFVRSKRQQNILLFQPNL